MKLINTKNIVLSIILVFSFGCATDSYKDHILNYFSEVEAPSAFIAVKDGTSVNLSWANPASNKFKQILIRRSTTAFPASPTKDTFVTETTEETYTDTGLTPGQTYYYSAFSKDVDDQYSKAVHTKVYFDNNNVYLQNLSFDNLTVSEPLEDNRTEYTIFANNEITQTNINYTLQDVNATGLLFKDGKLVNNPITLETGNNIYSLVIVAEDKKTTRNYTITITRQLNAYAMWAKNISDSNISITKITSDNNGNIYAVGYIGGGTIGGNGIFDFGNGVSVTITGASQNKKSILIKYNSDGIAQWAKAVDENGNIVFNSVALDKNGNIYTAGYIFGNTTFDFGNSISIIKTNSVDDYAELIIVKYNPDGIAQWAKSPDIPENTAIFNSIAVDNNGDIYAAGYIRIFNSDNSITVDFGNSVTLDGSGKYCTLMVKYSSAGIPQWAKSSNAPSGNSSQLNSVAVDDSGSIYTVGSTSGIADFGNGATLNNVKSNMLIIKYNPGGTPLWVKSATGNSASLKSVAIDKNNNIYTIGYVGGNSTINFGNDITLEGVSFSSNILLVKYDSNGTPLWAKSGITGTITSVYESIAIDENGYIYTAGTVGITNIATLEFNNNLKLEIDASNSFSTDTSAILLAQYDSNGDTQWVKSLKTLTIGSSFISLSVNNGYVYTLGKTYENGSLNFGDGVTLNLVNNTFLAKYRWE